MFRHLTTIILVFIANSFLTQVKIEGELQTELDNDIFYSIIVFDSDSNMVEGFSFEKKIFKLNIKQLASGNYLRIDAFGYFPFFFTLPKEENNIQLGAVKLEPNDSILDIVDVIYKKKLVESTNGNTKYLIDNSSLSHLGTGMDLAKILPGLAVNDGELEILGRGTPLILIDGQESSQRDLELLPSDQIASMEIVRNTGAEYSAESNTVLLITTISQKYNGWNFKLTNQLTKATYYRYYSGLNIGIKKQKSSYSLFIRTNPYKERIEENYYRRFEDSNYTVFNEVNKDILNINNFNIKLNTTQNLNKNNKIFFQSNNSLDKYGKEVWNQNQILQEITSDTINTNITSSLMKVKHQDILVFTHLFDTNGGYFKTTLSYMLIDDLNQQDISEQFDFVYRKSKAHFSSISQNFTVSPQMSIPFPKHKFNLKTGLRYSYLNSNSIYKYIDSTLNTIIENIGAIYLQGEKKFPKINIKGGLRYEIAKAEANQNNSQHLFERNFSNIFPNISFQFKLSKHITTGLGYAYRIKRPNLHDITSYRSFVDSLTSFSGNPQLLPEFSSVIDYNIVFMQMATVNASYIKTSNPIFHFISSEGFVTNVAQENFAFAEKINLSLSLPFKINFWTSYNSIGLISQKNVHEEPNLMTKNKMVYLSTFNSLKIKKTWNFDVQYQYNSNGLYGIFEYKRQHILSLYLRKSFLNKKLSFFLQWSDIFNQDVNNVTAIINDLSVKNYKFQDQKRVLFKVVYKLNSLNNLNSKRLINEDSDRLNKSE